MTYKEKVERARDLIRKADIEDVRRTPEETFQGFKNVELFEIAEFVARVFNLACDLRDVLEDEG